MPGSSFSVDVAAIRDRARQKMDQGPVTGEAPLTPIQRRFFAEGRQEPWRYNQAVLLARPLGRVRSGLQSRLTANLVSGLTGPWTGESRTRWPGSDLR